MAKPDPLPSLDKLQRDIDKVRPQNTEEQRSHSNEAVQKAMRMGVEFVSGIAVGSIVGYFIDRWLGTMPLFFVICFFLGTAAGFKNMFREANKMANEPEMNDKE